MTDGVFDIKGRFVGSVESVQEEPKRRKPKEVVMCMYPDCHYRGERGNFPLCKGRGTAMHNDWHYKTMKKLSGFSSMKAINKLGPVKMRRLTLMAYARMVELGEAAWK